MNAPTSSGTTPGTGNTRIVAYTYESNHHCIGCTRERFGPESLVQGRDNVQDLDENGISESQADREGNPIHPVFATDEFTEQSCGTCRGPF